MRKGPGSGYAQQTLIPEGAAVKVTPSKNSGSWWYVTYNGKSGYSYGKYLTTTAPKATQLIKDGTYEIAPNYATNMRLDVSGASKDNGANVQIYKANGTNAQKWKFKHLGNDYYTITCVASGKVLDVKSGNSKPGANVQQWGSNGSNAQIWKVKKADNGSYYLCPKLNEKVCLDVYKGGKTNSTNVTTWTLNNAYNQKWKIFCFQTKQQKAPFWGLFSISSARYSPLSFPRLSPAFPPTKGEFFRYSKCRRWKSSPE